MVRRIAVILATLAMVLSAVTFSFAELKITPERTTVVNSLPEVILYMDTDHNYKADVENTEVRVNETKTDIQDVQIFSKTGYGITYYILIDLSKSIAENDFKVIQEGIKGLINKLTSADKVVLIPFGEDIYSEWEVYDPEDKELIVDIDKLKLEDDYTKLYHAIDEVGYEAVNGDTANLTDRKVAMIFTDGMDDTTGGYEGVEEVEKTMRAAGVPLYGFVVGEDIKGKDGLGKLCRTLNGNISDINNDNIGAVLTEFKTIIDNTLMIKTNVRNSEDIGLEFAVRVLVDGEQILVKESIQANFTEDSKDVFAVATKKLILQYWWTILILAIAVIVIIALLVIKKNGGAVTVDGKVVYKKNIGKKVHIKPTELNSKVIEFIMSMDGSKPVKKDITVVSSIIVGRNSNCDVYFDDVHMSRQHFCIEIENNYLYINDLESTSGTYLNGVHVYSKQRLNSGDVIRAGRVEIKVHW